MTHAAETFNSYAARRWCVVSLCILCLGAWNTPPCSERTMRSQKSGVELPGDTVTVEGEVVVVGHEPFTRLRLVEKGGGGYILCFAGGDTIDLRRTGPTEVRLVGVPYEDDWQGREVRHLRVLRWEYIHR